MKRVFLFFAICLIVAVSFFIYFVVNFFCGDRGSERLTEWFLNKIKSRMYFVIDDTY